MPPTPPWSDRNRVLGLLYQLGATRDWVHNDLDKDALSLEFWAWDDASDQPAVVGTRTMGGTDANGQVYGVTDYAMTRGRTSVADHPEPQSLTFSLVGHLRVDDLDVAAPQIEVGMGVRLYLTPDAQLAGEDDAMVTRFAGQVTDLGDWTVDAASQTAVLPVTCSGMVYRLANNLATIAYAAGATTDMAMLDDVLLQVWAADHGARLGAWATDGPSWTYNPSDLASPYTLTAWQATDSADSLLATLADTVGGELFERRNGVVRWVTPTVRASFPVNVELNASEALSPIVFGQHIADLVNIMTVSYLEPGNPNTQAVTVSDGRSVNRRGKLASSIETQLANAADARDRGKDLVFRRSRPSWSVPTVTVDLTELLRRALEEYNAQTPPRFLVHSDSWNLFIALLKLDVAEPVRIHALPDTSPIPNGVFYADGITERITPGRWQLDLTLIPYGQVAFPTTWADLATDATDTWDGMDPDMSWDQATTWAPTPFASGTWDGIAGNLRWNRVSVDDPDTTFSEWTG